MNLIQEFSTNQDEVFVPLNFSKMGDDLRHHDGGVDPKHMAESHVLVLPTKAEDRQKRMSNPLPSS